MVKVTRTPRTCWRPLAFTLFVCFALSLGLTWRSDRYCYAGTCGSHLFPLQARLHVVVWYIWLSISITFLVLRARHPAVRKFVQQRVFERPIPFLEKKFAVGGALVLSWVLLLFGALIGLWWYKLHNYFGERGIEGGVHKGNNRLAAVALTGHLCDVTMGMTILPVSRHSALASFLKLSVSTTLTFHMLAAYTLFILVLTHGLLYVAWVPVFNGLSESLKRVYPVLNPTYLYHETWPGLRSGLGVWRASLIFTGCVTSFIMLMIFITTLPAIRRKHFNLFYFTHLSGILGLIIICLHASTMFYCTSPGLVMWLMDWTMRLVELRMPLPSNIKALGKGWYLLSAPLPRSRLRGCAKTSPLAHFFIHHSESSIRELHPFTTTTSLATQHANTDPSEEYITAQFLFRKRGAASKVTVAPTAEPTAHSLLGALWGKKARQPRPQWTNKLAGFANEEFDRPPSLTPASFSSTESADAKLPSKGEAVDLRLEGPYYTMADPHAYDTVVCIVAGTGVSGAMAISGAFKALDQQSLRHDNGAVSARAEKPLLEPTDSNGSLSSFDSDEVPRNLSVFCLENNRKWQRCIVVWTVREEHYVDLPELTGIPTPGFELRVHLTGKGRQRVSAGSVLDDILLGNSGEKGTVATGKTWVYISGPNAFIEGAEEACRGRADQGVDWYGARWDI